MTTLTKLALGLMGQFTPRPPVGNAAATMNLPPPHRTGGMPLMEALAGRESERTFSPQALDEQTLSDLLWAAAGVNRPELGGRTAPSAMNSQEVQLYVALPQGLFRYEPTAHVLHLEAATGVRRVTGYQDFVDTAPLDLIYVADHGRMKLVPAAQRATYAFTAAGAMTRTCTCTAPRRDSPPSSAPGSIARRSRRRWTFRPTSSCCWRRPWARGPTIQHGGPASTRSLAAAPPRTQRPHR
jgi:hypothetical protein